MDSNYIPYGHQNITQSDIDAVIQTLKSDWLTQGPAIERFEKCVAEACGAKYAVAVCNATGALHLACLAAGLGPSDELWTSPNTFVASANCGLYCGARPDFVDIELKTYNMDVQALEQKLEQASKNKKLPKVVVPVHFAGQSCDMKAIAKLKERYDFIVIEDASHAVGGKYQDTRVGSCRYSDMTVLSFHPVKIVTTGEGGMILTNRADLYEKLILLRSHGITRKSELMPQPPQGDWYYAQIDLGFNYRMTDLQAALGTSQMQRLETFIERRRELVARYNKALNDLPIITPWENPEIHSAWHLYAIRVPFDRSGRTRKQVFDKLRSRNIGVNVHYIPVHTQPYYQRLGFKAGMFPNSEKYYEEAISLPMYYGLSNGQQDRVIAELSEALKKS
jgi:UDP-4-amino-4,6-dideoxy-N-acetyl-beta-L-altrosamine transaminase